MVRDGVLAEDVPGNSGCKSSSFCSAYGTLRIYTPNETMIHGPTHVSSRPMARTRHREIFRRSIEICAQTLSETVQHGGELFSADRVVWREATVTYALYDPRVICPSDGFAVPLPRRHVIEDGAESYMWLTLHAI